MSVRSHRGGSNRMHRDIRSPTDAGHSGSTRASAFVGVELRPLGHRGSWDRRRRWLTGRPEGSASWGYRHTSLSPKRWRCSTPGAAGADVIVVDAVKSGAPPGTITIWDVRTSRPPTGQFRCSTHALGVAEAIELARALYRLPRKLIVVGIEGIRFNPGEPPSAEVAEAVERLARHIANGQKVALYRPMP